MALLFDDNSQNQPANVIPQEISDQALKMLFAKLAQSKFRSRFKLSSKEQAYLNEKGFEVITQHARDFITRRLAPANPPNDGKQTPMRNHPVFVAQHATATCCRKCLYKWHNIPIGTELTPDQIDYIVTVIFTWLKLHENKDRHSESL